MHGNSFLGCNIFVRPGKLKLVMQGGCRGGVSPGGARGVPGGCNTLRWSGMVRLTFPEIFSLLGAQVAKILTNVTFCDRQTDRQTDTA